MTDEPGNGKIVRREETLLQIGTTALDVTDTREWLIFEADPSDVQQKLQYQSGVYYYEAQQKALIDAKIVEIRDKIKKRREYLYIQYRGRKKDDKLTERMIDAMISVDTIISGLETIIGKLEVASKLKYELLTAMRMCAENVRIVGSNMRDERRVKP